MLMLHIIAAITSIAYSTFVLFNPLRATLKFSYGLIGATTATGVALMFMNPEYLLRGCISYILYLVAITALTYVTKNRQVLGK